MLGIPEFVTLFFGPFPDVFSMLQQGWPILIAAALAGCIDSISGGGGLITLPALLAIGIPPELLLGTNKCLSTLGSLPAVLRYRRAGFVPQLPLPLWLCGLLGAASMSALGALVSQQAMITERLHILVPFALFAVLAFVVKRWLWDERHRLVRDRDRHTQDTEALHRMGARSVRTSLPLAALGFYDGLFGPGTGTFLLSYFEQRGLSTLRANALTKIFNLASNLGALLWFLSQGRLVLGLGLMSAGVYLCGNYLGAGWVLSRGQTLVRTFVIGVSGLLLLKHLMRYFF